MRKKKTSFTLSEEAMGLLQAIANKQGISMAAVIELVVREKAKKEKAQVAG